MSFESLTAGVIGTIALLGLGQSASAQVSSGAASNRPAALQHAPPQQVFSDSIFRIRPGSPAPADNFCANLKIALAAARTNFAAIPGPIDEINPDWRDAKLTLPFVKDCTVDSTDKRDPSYFCRWKKEQGAAVNARYKDMVRQTDQCLAGFQKSTGDRATTWRNPAVGSVEVNAHPYSEDLSTWSVTLMVTR